MRLDGITSEFKFVSLYGGENRYKYLNYKIIAVQLHIYQKGTLLINTSLLLLRMYLTIKNKKVLFAGWGGGTGERGFPVLSGQYALFCRGVPLFCPGGAPVLSGGIPCLVWGCLLPSGQDLRQDFGQDQ